MNFLEILTAVLADYRGIPGLLDDDLVSMNEGESVGVNLSDIDKIKILRLQTMILEEIEIGQMPEDAVLSAIPKSKKGIRSERHNALLVLDDSLQRIQMLERIIIEIVRSNIPQQCEIFEVQYRVNRSMELVWSPFSESLIGC